MQPSRPASGSNGSQPPRGPGTPFWERAPRLSCAAAGLAIAAVLIALLVIGLDHPLIVLGLGAVMVGVFGAGLVFWKD
jgi:hypothetical protein